MQLDLWQAAVDALPWGGRSPRDLTKARNALFSKREEAKTLVVMPDPRQVDMFDAAIKGSPEYQGAPLLFPLALHERGVYHERKRRRSSEAHLPRREF